MLLLPVAILLLELLGTKVELLLLQLLSVEVELRVMRRGSLGLCRLLLGLLLLLLFNTITNQINLGQLF